MEIGSPEERMLACMYADAAYADVLGLTFLIAQRSFFRTAMGLPAHTHVRLVLALVKPKALGASELALELNGRRLAWEQSSSVGGSLT